MGWGRSWKWAWKKLTEGHCVRRQSWRKGYYWKIGKGRTLRHFGPGVQGGVAPLTTENEQAKDWVICTPREVSA